MQADRWCRKDLCVALSFGRLYTSKHAAIKQRPQHPTPHERQSSMRHKTVFLIVKRLRGWEIVQFYESLFALTPAGLGRPSISENDNRLPMAIFMW
jgi:hypothetical protein